jgi:hypothetical protein
MGRFVDRSRKLRLRVAALRIDNRIEKDATQNSIIKIWIADAQCDNGKRFVARADEKLTTFLELEVAIRACGKLS